MPIQKELAAALAECRSPTLHGKRAAHDNLAPVLTIVAKIQQQVGRHRELLLAAELAPHDGTVPGDVERLHQTLGALDKDCADFVSAGRRLALSMGQIERYADEIEESAKRREQK